MSKRKRISMTNEDIGRAGVAAVARGVRDGLIVGGCAYGLWWFVSRVVR